MSRIGFRLRLKDEAVVGEYVRLHEEIDERGRPRTTAIEEAFHMD